jgi:two-component system, cell cycle sensor histidine kinase and response regulator CckA
MGIRGENRIGKRSKSKGFGTNVASSAGTEKLSLDYQRGTETILIVDDEEPLRAVIGDLLTQLGYHILSAGNGDDALVIAADYRGRIDVLLSDVVMEGLPGPELAEKLLESRPELKVVFMSGFADSSLAPGGILEPGTVLVQKPFTIRILSTRLREVLDRPAGG